MCKEIVTTKVILKTLDSPMHNQQLLHIHTPPQLGYPLLAFHVSFCLLQTTNHDQNYAMEESYPYIPRNVKHEFRFE